MCATEARRSAPERRGADFCPLWRSSVAPLAPFSALGGLYGLRPWRSGSTFCLPVSDLGLCSRLFAPVGPLWLHFGLHLTAQTHEIHGFT